MELRSPGILKTRRGAALVEMAVVAPMLILLIFGGIDVGLLLRDDLALNQMAREAARSASVGGSASSVVSSQADSFGINASHVGVTQTNIGSGSYSYTGQTSGSEVAVTLSYPHQMLFGKLTGLGTTVQLSATMVMRYE